MNRRGFTLAVLTPLHARSILPLDREARPEREVRREREVRTDARL